MFKTHIAILHLLTKTKDPLFVPNNNLSTTWAKNKITYQS